ncbi:MAG: cell division protein ZapA [Neisseriaceae bacterium]|nr:cell division protein ZapA [Neisseriaceae bacterium]MBP6863515.1 cell division protein ZapA [Neisseriaceae bacterium]
MNPTPVDITIMGRTFTIATPEAERRTLLQAVDMLNDKIDTITKQGRIVETDKIAIIAALNLAHDLLKLTISGGLDVATLEHKITHMSRLCDEALASTPK